MKSLDRFGHPSIFSTMDVNEFYWVATMNEFCAKKAFFFQECVWRANTPDAMRRSH